MASLHIITKAKDGLRIPGVNVRIRSRQTMPLGCAGWPFVLDVSGPSDDRAVFDYNLGDFCSAIQPIDFELTATTPKGRVGTAVWRIPEIQYLGDYIFTVEIPGAGDEGSPGAEAADLWAVYGPYILVAGGLVGAYLVYRLIRKGTE